MDTRNRDQWGKGATRKQDVDEHAACWGHEVKVPFYPKKAKQAVHSYQRPHMHGMWDFGNNPLPSASMGAASGSHLAFWSLGSLITAKGQSKPSA